MAVGHRWPRLEAIKFQRSSKQKLGYFATFSPLPPSAMSQNVSAITSVPLNKKLKAELQFIATGMGLDANATVPKLRKAISEHMRTHPDLADDPKYLTVFAQRTGAASSVKTSADKASEEALQDPIIPEAVTGSKPIRRLSSQSYPSNSESGSDSESVASRPVTPVRKEHDKKAPLEEKKKKMVNAVVPEVIRVNFFDMNRPQAKPQEVPILSSDVNIATLTAQGGEVEYVASLKELLPVAFGNDSPMNSLP
ncbi:hypothetical protein R3P38DRAFT_2808210 [Favolaschia claudopus]|uniref:Uncharacterized protein n=1 Tax=Favolaschia claudopus TaxID=2862362 RepID=A0AAV9ZH75_9AGAR